MGFGDKFWSWLGIEHEEVREELLELPQNAEESRSPANIVSIHTNKTMKVVICEPESFDEVQILADHLKNRRQVIMNLEATPPDMAQDVYKRQLLLRERSLFVVDSVTVASSFTLLIPGLESPGIVRCV